MFVAARTQNTLASAADGSGRDELIEALAALGIEAGLSRNGVRIAGAKTRLVTHHLASPSRADAEALVRRVPPVANAVPVLVSERVSAGVEGILAAADWGWLDRRGRLHIHAPGLMIDRDVPAQVERPSPEVHEARRVLSSRVGLAVAAEVLLTPHAPNRVREIARRVDAAPSRVSTVLAALRNEALLLADNTPLVPELFDEIAAVWRPKRVALRRRPTLEDLDAGLGIVSSDDLVAPGLALHGALAANALGAPVVLGGDHPPDFFVPDDATLRAVVREFGTAEAGDDREATVAVAPVLSACEYRVAVPDVPWPVTRALFVALDLAVDAARGRESLDDWDPADADRVW